MILTILVLMTYPTGETIEAGQLVWINEGSQQAIIFQVIEDRDSLAGWGVEDIGIFVALSRPPKRDLFIGRRFFEDEGIGPVAPHEPQLL